MSDDFIGFFAFVWIAIGAIALATTTGGVVVGSIVCMAWGVFFGVLSAR